MVFRRRITLKKYVFLLLLLGNFSQASFTQNLQSSPIIKNGPSIDNEDITFKDVLKHDQNGAYYFYQKNITKRKLGLFVAHYDNNLQVNNEKLIPGVDPMNFKFGIQLKNQLYFYTTKKDSTGFYNLSYQKLNSQTLDPESEKQIATKGTSNSNKFYEAMSPKGSYLLIYSQNTSSSWHSAFLYFTVYDSSMTKLWERLIEIPIGAQFFQIDELKIDDSGKIYMVARENKTIIQQDSLQFHLYRFSEYATDNIDMPVDLNHFNKISTAHLLKKENGEMFLVGLYTDSISLCEQGAFCMSVDLQTQLISNLYMQAFKPEFIEEFESELIPENNLKNAFNFTPIPYYARFVIKDVILKKNGDITLIAEQDYQSCYMPQSASFDASGRFTVESWPGGTSCIWTHNDIIIVNFKNDGTSSWVSKIPKRQCAVFEEHSSFSFFYSANTIYFIYNDNLANYPTPPKNKRREEYNWKDAVVILTLVDENGNVSSNKANIAPVEYIHVAPRISEAGGPDDLILLSTRTLGYEFSKLTVQ